MTRRATSSASADAIVAIDIGGTTLKGAAFDSAGNVIARHTVLTFAIDVLAGLTALIRHLHTAAEQAGFRPSGIGIASPGLVDAASGSIVYAANLGWARLPLLELLEAEFALPVHIEHDARAGALAEQAAHADEEQAFRDFIFIPIGTGAAAAIVTSGLLVHGATGGAGEFGHIPIVPDGDLCTCGQHGCLEAYVSASNILARYERLGGRTALATPDVAQSLNADEIAATVWSDAVEALAIGVTSLSAVLDPARVVIGGGLSKAGDTLLAPLRVSVDQKLGWRTMPPIIQSTLGSHAGLIGAALLGSDYPLTADFALSAKQSLTSFVRLAPATAAETVLKAVND